MSEIIPVGSSIATTQVANTNETNFGSYLKDAASSLGTLAIEGAAAIGIGMPMELIGLIEMQRQLQIEMETVSMMSNIEKSRHESKMAAIRNIRTN